MSSADKGPAITPVLTKDPPSPRVILTSEKIRRSSSFNGNSPKIHLPRRSHANMPIQRAPERHNLLSVKLENLQPLEPDSASSMPLFGQRCLEPWKERIHHQDEDDRSSNISQRAFPTKKHLCLWLIVMGIALAIIVGLTLTVLITDKNTTETTETTTTTTTTWMEVTRTTTVAAPEMIDISAFTTTSERPTSYVSTIQTTMQSTAKQLPASDTTATSMGSARFEFTMTSNTPTESSSLNAAMTSKSNPTTIETITSNSVAITVTYSDPCEHLRACIEANEIAMLDSDDFSKTSKSRPLADVLHIFILLVVVKVLKTFGLFITYDLLKSYHLVLILFLATLFTSVCLLFIQKPFSSSFRPNRVLFFRLIKYTICLTVIRLLWLFGLTLCGPLRTILLFEHSDVVILACFQVLFSSSMNGQQGQTSRIRGVVFFALAVLAIFAFDNDDLQQRVDHPEGHSHHRFFAHIFYRLTSLIGVADHKGGVILLLLALFARCAMNSWSKKLVLDIGGPKKFYAITTCLSTVCLIPMSFVMLLVNNLFLDATDAARAAFQTTTSSSTTSSFFGNTTSLIIPVVIISLFIFVFDFYAEQIAIVKLDRIRTFRYGTLTTIFAALLISFFWVQTVTVANSKAWLGRTMDVEEHVLSGGVVFAVVMFAFATDLLSSPIRQRSGAFIGYSQEGVPLFNLTHQRSQSLLLIIKSSLRDILAESDSRQIFYFLCINLAFTFVELLYGAWTNSLGLLSDGFHMLFDCTALVVGLYAALMARWKPTRVFSYGYGRVEVLSGFVNGLFLVVVAFFVFYEAIGRLFEPPEINTNRLLIVSVAGFGVNMIGIFSFSHAHAHAHGGGGGCAMSHAAPAKEQHQHGHSHDSHDHSHSHSHGHSHGEGGHDHGHSHGPAEKSSQHGHSHSMRDNANMKGVFLHVLADTLGSVGVIISSLLIQFFGWNISDPICSLFISIMIFLSVLPLLKDSAMTLLLQTPSNIQYEILDRILKLDQVQSYSDEHFWNLTSSTIVGTLHIQIASDGDEQRVTAQVQAILKDAQIQNVAIQVEKQVFLNHLNGLNSALGQLASSERTFAHR